MKSTRLFWAFFILVASTNEMVIGQGSSTDTVVTAVAPVYPRLARLTRTSGKLRVEVYVDKYGAVTNATAIKGEPDSYVPFREVSERTARRWVFSASSADTVQRKYVITFNYRIMPNETPEDELMPIYHYPFEIEVRNTAANPHKFEDPPVYHD
ncbi:MAG: energy transducer TonB [Acidobacteria bacterium]|nr:energy transducer TonB [Acidobacteriota bacterium]